VAIAVGPAAPQLSGDEKDGSLMRSKSISLRGREAAARWRGVGALALDRARIEERVLAAERLGQERKQREQHRDAVAPRAQ
jgi:hypothetical protein